MKWCIALLAGLLAVAASQAQTVSDAEKKEGFVPLFNGKDFTGWRFSPSAALPDKIPDSSKVEDGVIKITGKPPHLGTQWDYEDFDVRIEWRAMQPSYNSGFYIRSGRNVGANQINLGKGDEGHFIGGKLDKGGQKVPELQNKWGEWNSWRVLAVGDKVTFWCNDKLAWEGSGLKPARGYIGLQQEGAKIEFRNLRIKELGYETLSDTKKDYKDYVLRVEYKADKDATGSVALRGPKADHALVKIGDTAEGSGSVAGKKPTKKLDNPLGQWNYLELRVQGDKASVWLNGTFVVEKVDLKGGPEMGGAALLGKGIDFRKARIKELK